MSGAAFRIVRAALFAVSAFLLVSYGGAIVAAPLTLPAMYFVVRRDPTIGWRAAGVLIGATTAAEVMWALTYVTVGESKPWIWFVPLASACAAIAVFARVATVRRPHRLA